MELLRALLLLCLVVLTGHAAAQDPEDAPVNCGSEKVAVFEGSVSPDGHYAFGWTVRPVGNRPPVDWTDYDPTSAYGWLQPYVFPEASKPEYQLLNGVVDLRAHRFTPLDSQYPYWPHKNHGETGFAWSHGSQSGKFAVVHNDARFFTMDLWLVETGGAGVHVVDLAGPVEKSVRRFLRQQYPKEYESLAVTYGDVSFGHGSALIDFSAEVPKALYGVGTEGTVRVTLPAGTIAGVKSR